MLQALTKLFTPVKVLPPIDPPAGDPVLSFLEQTPWRAGLYRFQNEGINAQFFNGAIVRAWGKDVLVVRKHNGSPGTMGKNEIWLYDVLDDNVYNPRKIKFSNSSSHDHFEDPRALWRNGALMVSYCCFRMGGKYGHQQIAQVEESGYNQFRFSPVYGKNGKDMMSNEWHEKNWTWFDWKGKLMLIYSIANGHEIVDYSGRVINEVHQSGSSFEWLWGQPRGGTNPILVGDQYWSFFHSSSMISPKRRRYYMGAYSFESKPPFRILSHTTEPLLAGSDRDPRHMHNPPVVFPCGAIIKDGIWTVSLGINDYREGWIKIPHSDLEGRMKLTAESVSPNLVKI